MNTDFKQVLANLEKLREDYPAVAKASAIEFGGLCVAIGKSSRIIPKRTGNLRSTARVEVTRDNVVFVTGGIVGKPQSAKYEPKLVNYASFVNWGTSMQSPQFFMERIIQIASAQSDPLFKKAIQSWLDNSKN